MTITLGDSQLIGLGGATDVSLPDATTWTGDTGRTWTANGADVTVSRRIVHMLNTITERTLAIIGVDDSALAVITVGDSL